MSGQHRTTTSAPFSLRLTTEEREELERQAAGMSLGSYIRWRLFEPNSPPPRSRGKFPVKDHAALAQLLALLGQSRLASNLNQLAKAANAGSLPVTPETEDTLRLVCRHIADMRRMLVVALGLASEGQ